MVSQLRTLVIGPTTRSPGLAFCINILDLKGVIAWETPSARTNCSRSSTLVRPLAEVLEVRVDAGGGKHKTKNKIYKKTN